MIGTTRSRVNFFMNKFRKLGFIEYHGKIKINKSLLLSYTSKTARSLRLIGIAPLIQQKSPVVQAHPTFCSIGVKR